MVFSALVLGFLAFIALWDSSDTDFPSTRG